MRAILESTGPSIPAARRFTLLGAIAAALLAGAAPAARAQSYGPFAGRQSRAIRETTDEILSSPEFRGFPRLDRDEEGLLEEPGSPPGTPGAGSGSGEQAGEPGAGEADDNAAGQGGEAREEPVDGSTPVAPGAPLLSGALGAIYQLVAWALVAAVIGFILYLVVKALQDYERSETLGDADGDESEQRQGERPPEEAPGELPADVYQQRARELAAAGRYREAIAQLLLGAMSRIERAGMIRHRQGLTYDDYLRAARRQGGMAEAFREMVRVYQPLGFGRRRAGAEHFERSLSQYEAGFGAPSETAEE